MRSPADLPGKKATYEDVLAAPEDRVAELLDGELVLSPRPGKRHTFFASGLGGELYSPFQRGRGGPGGWVILDEPELHLHQHVLVPDLAGWRRERFEPNDEGAWYAVAPDWVCEVLSPSTEGLDRTRKLRIYAEERVSHVWLADPALRTLEVLSLTGGKWTLQGAFMGGEQVKAPPFEAITLALGPLWSPDESP